MKHLEISALHANGLKKCKHCDTIKPLSEYFKRKGRKWGLGSRCKECLKKDNRKYVGRYIPKQKTGDDLIKHREYRKTIDCRRRSTPEGKLNRSIGGRIWESLRGNKDGCKWETITGFTLQDLVIHLEKQFSPEMNWGNYGSYWHIDHKTPIAAFNFKKYSDIDFKRCWNINNLQPLEKKANQKKSDKVESPFQPSLLLPEPCGAFSLAKGIS